ncbi:MAG: hypothetical protein K2J63_04355, partial [Muribaculaceae bacterium]|nr:hypothetical protein [Muribaculaceae bacterium]
MMVSEMHTKGQLTSTDYKAMEDLLRLKASDLRIGIISILGSLPENDAIASVRRLLSNKNVERRLGGLDIIKNWIKDGERKELCQELIKDVKSITHPTPKEQILIDDILSTLTSEDIVYDSKNGFGLYDPDEEVRFVLPKPDGFNVQEVFAFADDKYTERILQKLLSVIALHPDLDFAESGEEGTKILQEFYDKEIGNASDMLKLYLAINKAERFESPFFPVIERFLGFPLHTFQRISKELSSSPDYSLARQIICRLFWLNYSGDMAWQTALNVISKAALEMSGDDMVKMVEDGLYITVDKHRLIFDVFPFSVFMDKLKNESYLKEDERFVQSFKVRYEIYRKTNYRNQYDCRCFILITPFEFLRAWRLGVISDKEFYHNMLGRETAEDMIYRLTYRIPDPSRRYNTDDKLLSPDECKLVEKAVDRILDIELKRGDSLTEVWHLANTIQLVKGADYFIKILTGLGNDIPNRGHYFFASDGSKREILSRLLYNCSPTENDTPERLKKLAEEAGISNGRLVEAAMFSTRWLDIVERAIGWEGLASGAYYFLAHTTDNCNDRVKSHIARYTSVPPEDFADGAFDPMWFQDMYRLLGKSRYEAVYKSAKYITDGHGYIRVRKLSDALLGNLKIEAVAKEIEEKRNKDSVVAYGVIPLSHNRTEDLRQRYGLLQKFLKESKQFGALRQSSESKAVKLALDNLARTAGYGDATRLTWSMEAGFIKEVEEYLKPKEIEGITISIS